MRLVGFTLSEQVDFRLHQEPADPYRIKGVTAIFETVDDQWTARVASDVKEATTLIEAGFEYVTGDYSDGGKIFRKRK